MCYERATVKRSRSEFFLFVPSECSELDTPEFAGDEDKQDDSRKKFILRAERV
jgi:hypothetical protein